MTHRSLLPPPDPRKHPPFYLQRHLHTLDVSSPCPRKSLSRKFSLNEGRPPTPIQRRSSLPAPSRTHHTRPPSLPHTPLVTIPLRPCCPDCFSATERAALQGDSWTENFTRAAHRRRSASTDNRPCPPHVLADSGTTTIQWSTVSDVAPPTIHSVIVVDEADREVKDLKDDVSPASNDEGLSTTQTRFDHLSVKEPQDDVLPPLLSAHKRWLSPIPSNNPSVDDLPPTCTATEEVDISPTPYPTTSPSVTPPSSPLPETPPSSSFSTPMSSPIISSSPHHPGRRSSPRIPSSFRIPKGSSLMRTGSDILKGVSLLGSGPM